MFDLATRPQRLDDVSAALSVPFDWQLTAPAAATSYPFTDYSSGAPAPGVEVLQTFALQLEDTLSSAVIISLFTDRRAGPDDRLPYGQTDRRGWVGDEFMGAGFDQQRTGWGSLLWLYYSTKTVAEVLEASRFTARESLAWMVDAEIASRIKVEALWAGPREDRLALRVTIYQADQLQPVYDVLWGTSFLRGGQ